MTSVQLQESTLISQTKHRGWLRPQCGILSGHSVYSANPHAPQQRAHTFYEVVTLLGYICLTHYLLIKLDFGDNICKWSFFLMNCVLPSSAPRDKPSPDWQLEVTCWVLSWKIVEDPEQRSHLPEICLPGYEVPHKYLAPAHQPPAHHFPDGVWAVGCWGRAVMDALWHGPTLLGACADNGTRGVMWGWIQAIKLYFCVFG